MTIEKDLKKLLVETLIPDDSEVTYEQMLSSYDSQLEMAGSSERGSSDQSYSPSSVPLVNAHCRLVRYNHGPFANADIMYSSKRLSGSGRKAVTPDQVVDPDDILEKEKIDSRPASLRRTKKILTRIIRHNYSSNTRLGTLTFAKGTHDLDEAWHAIHMMSIRFEKEHGYKLRYIAVPEPHPNGHGWHFHLIIDTPWFDFSIFIKKIWRMGLVFFSPQPQGNAHDLAINAASYLCKYVEKDMELRPAGRKRYSRGGDWATDWQIDSGVTCYPSVIATELLAYLNSLGIESSRYMMPLYTGQVLLCFTFSTGTCPVLDLTRFVPVYGEGRAGPGFYEEPISPYDIIKERSNEIRVQESTFQFPDR